MTLVAALAAADACEEVAGVTPDLKWPNDLLEPGGDHKLGGILAELVTGQDDMNAVVVGLGLNVRWHAPLPPGAVDLRSISGTSHPDREPDRETLLAAFLCRLEDRLSEPRHDLLAGYRSRCVTIGRQVRVVLTNSEVSGRATGVDHDGHLLMTDRAGREHTLRAGDVVHQRHR